MHEHKWCKTGMWEPGKKKAVYPCLLPGCEAALLKTPGQDISTGEVLPSRFPQNDPVFDDDPEGGVAKVIQAEVEEDYGLDKIKFKSGDVVIDIGAHVGVVSVMLAKKHPNIIIYAFEPVMENFARLVSNLNANGAINVVAVNKAVTGDGRRLQMRVNLSANSAGSSAYIDDKEAQVIEAESVTLADIFEQFDIDRCKLLKIDSEGIEYDVLLNAPGNVLARIDYVRGEIHTNKRLKKVGYRPVALRKHLRQYVKNVRMNNQKMAE